MFLNGVLALAVTIRIITKDQPSNEKKQSCQNGYPFSVSPNSNRPGGAGRNNSLIKVGTDVRD